MRDNYKKIYIDINGHAGNQLFQYAFARTLMETDNYELIIDFCNVLKKNNSVSDRNSFRDYLQYFDVVKYKLLNDSGYTGKKYGSKKQKRMLKHYFLLRKISPHFPRLKLLRKYQFKMQENGIYKEDECDVSIFTKIFS